jgi:hypothetical protein
MAMPAVLAIGAVQPKSGFSPIERFRSYVETGPSGGLVGVTIRDDRVYANIFEGGSLQRVAINPRTAAPA